MLEAFRKYKRLMVAILGVIAMLSFVVLPLVQQYYSAQPVRQTDPKEKVMLAGTEITEGQIEQKRYIHGRTIEFLARVSDLVLRRGGSPRVPGFVMSQEGVIRPGIDISSSRGHVVQTMLMAHEARQQGFELGDDAIDQWLRNFTDDKVSGQEVNDILKSVTEGRIGRNQLYGHLKDELLADLMSRMGCLGINGRGELSMRGSSLITTPATTWKNFLKLNQSANVSVFPVFTADYVDQVPKQEFSEQQLKEVYEEGKENYPNKNSSQPGFRRRFRANVEFVSASTEQFLEEAKKGFTEEQLREEYDKRVASGNFVIPEPPTTEDKKPDDSKTETPSSEANNTPATDTTPATPETNPAPDPVTPPEQGASSETKQEVPESSTNPNASNVRSESIRLVALQEEPKPDLPTETPRTAEGQPGQSPQPEPKSDEPKPENPIPQDRPQGEAPPPELPEAEPRKAEPLGAEPNIGEAQDAKTVVPNADTPLATEPEKKESPTDPSVTSSKPEKKIRPFEEVREQIARSLAMPVAIQRRSQVIQNARAEMRAYFLKYSAYEVDTKNGKKVDQPTPPDLSKLAEKLGLQYGKTGMCDSLGAREFPIGKTITSDGKDFGSMVFHAEAPKYYPYETTDFISHGYVFWKIEEEKEYLPTQAEVRDEIVNFLVTREARKLAEEAAQRIAEEAAKGDVPLQECVKETQRNLVQENIGPFTWMQSFSRTGSPMISIVSGLDQPGEEFMKRVFATPPGQFTVAPNTPQTVFYVVKVNQLSPDVAKLREDFLRPADRMQALSLAREQNHRLRQDWLDGVVERLGLKVPDNF